MVLDICFPFLHYKQGKKLRTGIEHAQRSMIEKLTLTFQNYFEI
jgi:hypothetical protein